LPRKAIYRGRQFLAWAQACLALGERHGAMKFSLVVDVL
jgi:hypothetical protein